MEPDVRNVSSARRVAIALVLTAASLVVATRIEIGNDLHSWTVLEAEEENRYERFRQTFGTDEFILVAISGAGLLDEETLDVLLDVAEHLEALDPVTRVFGPPTLYRDLFGAEDPQALWQELFTTDFYQRLVLSADGRTLGLFLAIDPRDGAAGRRTLVAAVRQALAPLRSLGLEYHLVGPPILTAELDAVSLAETRRSLPLAAGASLLLLGFLLRSLRATFIAISCSTSTIALTLGLMSLLGHRLNMFTSALPPLLWVLSLASILHILVRYRQELDHRSHTAALQHALDRARFPCTLSSATTAAGFFSLNLAPMQPVRQLGSLAGIGILLSLAVSFWLGPALIDLLRPVSATRRRPGRGGGLVSRLATSAYDHPLWAIAPFLAATLAGLFGLAAIKPSSNPLSFLPRSSVLRTDYLYVSRELSGMSTLEMVLPTPRAWTQPSVWKDAVEIERLLLTHPAVAKVRSPLSILKKLNQWDNELDPEHYRLPANHEQAARLLEEIDPALESELQSLVASDGRSLRLSVLITAMDSERFASVEALARRELAQRFGNDAWVTGIVPLLVRVQRQLVASQLRSLSLAAVVVFGCIWIGLRSLRWAAIAMLPNVVPVATVFLSMAALGLPLDPGTIMVAGVALGIAVDDTVHIVSSLRRTGADPLSRSAVYSAIATVGSALTITTATATVGFASLAVARFLPIRYFGLLTALAMVVALSACLVLLPALLALRHRQRPSLDPQASPP